MIIIYYLKPIKLLFSISSIILTNQFDYFDLLVQLF